MRSCVWTRNKPDRGDLDSLRPSRPTPVRGLKEGTSDPPSSSRSTPRPGARWRRRGRVRAQVVPRRPGRWIGAGRRWWHDGRPRLGSASADLGCRYRLGARRPGDRSHRGRWYLSTFDGAEFDQTREHPRRLCDAHTGQLGDGPEVELSGRLGQHRQHATLGTRHDGLDRSHEIHERQPIPIAGKSGTVVPFMTCSHQGSRGR